MNFTNTAYAVGTVADIDLECTTFYSQPDCLSDVSPFYLISIFGSGILLLVFILASISWFFRSFINITN